MKIRRLQKHSRPLPQKLYGIICIYNLHLYTTSIPSKTISAIRQPHDFQEKFALFPENYISGIQSFREYRFSYKIVSGIRWKHPLGSLKFASTHEIITYNSVEILCKSNHTNMAILIPITLRF